MSRYTDRHDTEPTLMPYRDDPTTTHAQRELPSTPSSHRPAELQDYWDNGPPPPHRLNNGLSPNSSTESLHDPFNPYTRYSSTPAPIPTQSSLRAPPIMTGSGYNNLNNPSETRNTSWLEKEQSKSRSARRWTIVAIAVVVAAIIGGIVAGVVVAKSKSNKSSSSSSSSSADVPASANSTTGNGAADPSTGFFSVVKQNNPNDPSTFVKDDSLKNAFYGVAYTPFGSIVPDCGANIQAVIEDIQLISQITNRLRLYGADCNITALVLEAVKLTKVDLQVYVGNYVLPNDDVTYTRQRDTIFDAIKTYGEDSVAGITVGNEYMLNYLTDNGGANQDVNGVTANTGAAYLVDKIKDTRTTLASMNFKKTIPVGTSDAGAFFNNLVLEAVDYGMANVHPWFADTSIDNAAQWTFEFFQNTDIAASNNVTNKPVMYIAETGWPTQSSTVAAESNGVSTASVANLQTFLDTFTCSANSNKVNYFFFEVFDEPWKNVTFGGVEGYWGLFNFNKTLKAGITMPTCSHN